MASPPSVDGDTGVIEGALLGLEVPPAITPSQWAERYFVMSAEGSPEPGRYSASRARYQAGMLDVFVEEGIHEISFKTSAQVGKTTLLLIIVGYTAHRAPGPMLFVEPTLEMVESFVKEKLDPAIRDCPALAATFPPAKSRDGDNTIRHKSFPGGFIALTGANSPTSMRMRAIKLGLADEIDTYDSDVGGEGDPIELIRKRGQTFWDAKLLLASTPLHKGSSKISRAYEESDQRLFMVPCPHCDEFQALRWKAKEDGGAPSNIRWTPGKPETALYVCEKNGCLLDDSDIKNAVRYGHWQAMQPFNGKAGFWMWELYSPWSSLSRIVKAYENAIGYSTRMQSFWNTVLGLEWAGAVRGTIEAKTLLARVEDYPALRLPDRAGFLTAGVDVQHDRLEVQVQAWGLNDERWIMQHMQLMGDPNAPNVWENLIEVLNRRYATRNEARTLGIEVAMIDSGGHHTQKVYDFCAVHLLSGRQWWPIKGVAGAGRPIWKRSEEMVRKGVKLILVGVDDAKAHVQSALAVEAPGPNYVHLPRSMDLQSLERLTAERLHVTIDKKGFEKREWHKPEAARNEEWDCAVYNLAARRSVNLDMGRRLEMLSKPVKPAIDAAELARKFK